MPPRDHSRRILNDRVVGSSLRRAACARPAGPRGAAWFPERCGTRLRDMRAAHRSQIFCDASVQFSGALGAPVCLRAARASCCSLLGI